MMSPKMWLSAKVVLVSVLVGLVVKIVFKPLGENMPVDLSGKTFIVTGSTSGLGKWHVEKLAEWNATLVLPVRDVPKGVALAKSLVEKFPGIPTPSIFDMDLSSLESVRQFAKSYDGPVDVLVHNAALLGHGELRRTVDGFEECLQANYLSTVLLTSLLLDRIEASSAGRVVHVAAHAYELANISVNAMLTEKVLGPDFTERQNFMGNLGGSYADSKLAQILFSGALARRLKSGVVTHSLHPAVASTGLVRDQNNFRQFMLGFMTQLLGRTLGLMQTAEDAPKTQIHVSTHPALQEVNGRYYSAMNPPLLNCGKPAADCAWVQTFSKNAANEDLQEELFKASCQVLALSDGMCSRQLT